MLKYAHIQERRYRMEKQQFDENKLCPKGKKYVAGFDKYHDLARQEACMGDDESDTSDTLDKEFKFRHIRDCFGKKFEKHTTTCVPCREQFDLLG